MRTVSTVSNAIIARLPRAARTSLFRGCVEVHLEFGQTLVDARQPFTDVYFPLTGFISLVAGVPEHRPLEIGLIGNEGMLGATLALRMRQAPIRAVVQGSGSALRISVAAFSRELLENSALLGALNRYLHLTIAQLARGSVCTRFHKIEPRLARWLLMTHDRAHADTFYLTHEYLSSMLGVRRSGVSIAAHRLQQKKLIRYQRGEISVLDRRGLEARACVCYAHLNSDYASAFP